MVPCVKCKGELHTQHTTHLPPHTPHLTPHTSHLTPHTSHHTPHLTPHTPHTSPHTSHLTSHTPHLTPHTSHLTHHTPHLTHYISFVAGISSPDTPHRLSLLREVANALAKPTRSHEDNIIILACSIFTKKNQFCVTIRTAGPYEAS